jgi:hypothetical protein
MNRTINNNLTAFPERDLAETSGFVGLLILPKHDERFPASCIVCSSALLLVTSSAHPSCVRIETYRYQLVAATFSWSRLLGHRPRVDFVRESAHRKKCLLPDMLALPADGFAGGSVKSGPL